MGSGSPPTRSRCRGAHGGLVGGRHLVSRVRRDIFRQSARQDGVGLLREGAGFLRRQHSKPKTKEHASHSRERPIHLLGDDSLARSVGSRQAKALPIMSPTFATVVMPNVPP
jgi:hypothetical protein